MRLSLSVFFCLATLFNVFSQTDITVEDIWRDYKFIGNRVAGFNFQNDGVHFTRNVDGNVIQFDLKTGKQTKLLMDLAAERKKNPSIPTDIDGYTFSDDESKLMIQTGTEAIYRRSYKSNYFVKYKTNEPAKVLSQIGKQMHATFSPDGTKVAYVIDNDLYFKDLNSDKEFRITKDGRFNKIINGSADWVYEEEFSFSKAFQWSPDSKRIAFMRFDESRVREFTMTLYKDEVYPEYETFKYPKVGEDNAIVTIHIYELSTGSTVKADLPYELPKMDALDQVYFPRVKWTQDPARLCVTKMNRLQNELELFLVEAGNGKATSILKESNPYYINITDNLTFLKNGKEFIWTSEKDGFNHIYIYNLKGKQLRQLTSGNYEVTSFYGVDEVNGKVYFQAAAENPMNREVYAVDLKGKSKQRLTPDDGTNRAQFSSTFDYYVNTFSTANTGATYRVYDISGKLIRSIEENLGIADLQKTYSTQPVEFIKVPSADPAIELNASIIKPPNFDESKSYPLFMYVYGGPGSQTVTNSFGGFDYWWFQMLAQKGYLVVSVDNRGTGARGQEFKKMTYKQLGKHETEDQIAAAQYLGKLGYVDKDRIGIFGWSYGGYMSSLCLFKGADVFKSAIAVAPVTNWKWYDSIYTERYMQTLATNAEGYQENSPVYFADLLKGNYLIIHGNADDNVHFQNTTEMVKALVNANKQFDTYFYPNRNHGIYGGNTRLHLYTKMTNFLTEKL